MTQHLHLVFCSKQLTAKVFRGLRSIYGIGTCHNNCEGYGVSNAKKYSRADNAHICNFTAHVHRWRHETPSTFAISELG